MKEVVQAGNGAPGFSAEHELCEALKRQLKLMNYFSHSLPSTRRDAMNPAPPQRTLSRTTNERMSPGRYRSIRFGNDNNKTTSYVSTGVVAVQPTVALNLLRSFDLLLNGDSHVLQSLQLLSHFLLNLTMGLNDA